MVFVIESGDIRLADQVTKFVSHGVDGVLMFALKHDPDKWFCAGMANENPTIGAQFFLHFCHSLVEAGD